MSEDTEKARVEAEARRLQSGMTSADRTRFWSGLNRYLASEAEHAQRLAEEERPSAQPAASEPSTPSASVKPQRKPTEQ